MGQVAPEEAVLRETQSRRRHAIGGVYAPPGKKATVFKAKSETKAAEIFSGVLRRTLSHTDRAMLTEMTVGKGSRAETHEHPNDEIGYVSSGRIRTEIGGESRDLGPGDSYSVEAGQAHALEALEDSVCIVAFAPLRTEYMD